VDPHGFKGYSNQTLVNDKAIFVPRFIANSSISGICKDGDGERRDGVASIKQRRRDLQSDGVKDFVTALEHSRLKEDLELSTPSHDGYRNTIELLEGNNVVPLRSDTILFMQNGCKSEDPNQHLKDFLKLVDSLDLDVANRERTRMMEKLRNDILMFQQHQGKSLSEA
ncbi:hypothetical protein Tco_1340808, partial [Tanacetum coccineum]